MKKLSSMLALGLAFSLTLGMTAFAAVEGSGTGEDVTPSTPIVTDPAIEEAFDQLPEEDKAVLSEAATNFATGVGVTATVTDAEGNEVVLDNTSVKPVSPVTLFDMVATGGQAIYDQVVEAGNVENFGITRPEATGNGTYVWDFVPVAAMQLPDVVFDQETEITFQIPGVEVGQQYVFLHLNHDGEWEAIPAVVTGNGQLTGKFTSLSPLSAQMVVIEFEPDDVQPEQPEKPDEKPVDTAPWWDWGPAENTATATGTTSPKTGETLPVVGIIALICLAGAAVSVKKVSFNR